MGAVDASVSGVAGSLNSLARTIGMTIGISFGATLLFAQLPGRHANFAAVGAPFLHALAICFLVSNHCFRGWINNCHFSNNSQSANEGFSSINPSETYESG